MCTKVAIKLPSEVLLMSFFFKFVFHGSVTAMYIFKRGERMLQYRQRYYRSWIMSCDVSVFEKLCFCRPTIDRRFLHSGKRFRKPPFS